jgi:hypothetical protein
LDAANSGRHFEGINAAQPDLVIAVFNLNDPCISHASMLVDRRTDILMMEQEGWLVERSRLYRFIKKRILKKKVNDYTIRNIEDGYFGPMRAQRWEKAQRVSNPRSRTRLKEWRNERLGTFFAFV